MKIVYLPIGVGTYHMETAHDRFDRSVGLLKSFEEQAEIVMPEDIIFSADGVRAALEGQQPDLVILQNITFANAAYTAEALRDTACPVLLWTLREPALPNRRLALNSLTGAFAASNTMAAFGRPFEQVIGDPDEPETAEAIGRVIRAVGAVCMLRGLNVLQIGHTPEGFSFGRAMDNDITKVFGSRLISIEARELIDMAKGYSEEEAREYLDRASAAICGLDKTEPKNLMDFARLYRAYDTYTREHRIGALASRCWPDFFTAFGTPVCAVLSLLNDLGIPSACEVDTYGALSMAVAAYLSGQPAFFGDPVSMDTADNTLTFWHCGMAACSLARKDRGAEAGVHCNRKIGPTLEFGCRPSDRATVFRIGRDPEGRIRTYIRKGSIPDMPPKYIGTCLTFRAEEAVDRLVKDTVAAGWEPHYAVAYADISEELRIFTKFLGL